MKLSIRSELFASCAIIINSYNAFDGSGVSIFGTVSRIGLFGMLDSEYSIATSWLMFSLAMVEVEVTLQLRSRLPRQASGKAASLSLMKALTLKSTPSA